MPQAAQLVVKVAAEGVQETERQLESVGKKTEETKEHFKGLKDALSTAAGFAIFGAGMAGVGFLKDQVSDIIKVTSQYQLTQAQTNQVLKSTHDVSGMTKNALNDLADAYGRTTMFSADTVQSGENLLLTFTNIGKSVFPQATQAILDVSQAMGQDLKSSAIQVGKALGDPLHGYAQLQRIGVTFSEEEKKQIKTMSAHNDIIGAQKIILHELSTEFGGSATAAGKTFAGQLAIMGNTFDEIKVKIGSALLPVLSDLLNRYIVPLATKFQDWMLKGGGLNDFQQWIKTASNFLQSQLIPSLSQMLNQYIIPLGQSMYDLFIKTGFVSGVWSDLVSIGQTFLPLIGGLVTQLTNFAGWMSKGSEGTNAVKAALIGVAGAIALVKIYQFGSDAVTAFTNAKNSVSTFVDWISKIGPASQTSAAEMDVAAATEETDLAGVNVAAVTASEGVAGIGVAAAASLGPIIAISAAVKWLLDNRANIIDWITGVKNAGAGLQGIPSTPGLPGFLPGNPNGPNFGSGNINSDNTNPNNLNAMRRHASGILNNPVGHWAMVGERGPEPMYVPAGASILPSGSTIPGSGGSQAVYLQIDGNTLARLMMPAIANQLRNNVPIYGA